MNAEYDSVTQRAPDLDSLRANLKNDASRSVPVADILNVSDKVVSDLEAAVKKLESRLVAVMVPFPKEPTNKEEMVKSAHSSLYLKIEGLNKRIARVVQQLYVMEENLEV